MEGGSGRGDIAWQSEAIVVKEFAVVLPCDVRDVLFVLFSWNRGGVGYSPRWGVWGTVWAGFRVRAESRAGIG